MRISDKSKSTRIFSKLAYRIHELKTMFPVKSEPSDTFVVGKDSQPTICFDDNQDISDTLHSDSSDNRPVKILSDEMLLTVAYVKNGSTSHAFDYNTSNSNENECIHEQQLNDINVIKTEKTDACSDNTSGGVTGEEHMTMQVKEESEHFHIQDHDIHHEADIPPYDKVGEMDTIDIGYICPSRPTQKIYEIHNNFHKKVHSGATCKLTHSGDKCDLCAYSDRRYDHMKKHKQLLIHSKHKPYKCDICDYNTRTSGNLMTHKLKHSGERPHKCESCSYSATTPCNLKKHKLIHSGEKPFKCDICGYSTTQAGALRTHQLIHSEKIPTNVMYVTMVLQRLRILRNIN